MATQLHQFLADFNGPNRNDLLRRLQENEGAVYAKYGVVQADLDSLKALTPNARTLLPVPIVVLIQGLARLPDEDEPELKWPGPKLRVAEVQPKSVSRGEQEVTIVISVSEFPTNAPHRHDGKPYKVLVAFKHTDGTEVKGTPMSPLRLEPADIASVSLVCKATFVKPGDYGGLITVIGYPEGKDPYETEAWFTSASLTVE